jgi:signal transduction histidine kinase
MTVPRMRAVVLAALVCGAAVVALMLSSDHQDAKTAWAIFGPAVGWSFVGVGLYAWRRRPQSRTGELMVVLGFAWFLSALGFSDSPLLYSFGFAVGGLWGGVFLQLIMSFPSGRLSPGWDRRLVIAGYLIFTVASVPAMLVAGPHELGCDDCPTNVLLISPDPDLASIALGSVVVLYAVLFVIVLVRLIMRWRRAGQLERLQLTPVYVCGLLTFLLATVATAGAGDAAGWAVLSATALLPFAFLAGLLRSHVARLDSDLRARVEELRASRARLVEAGDTERRRLERNLHDGAQARLVGLALLLGHARRRVESDPVETAALLDRGMVELKASLAELRELARGIHPAVLTERGLGPALNAIASRAPVPVTLDTDGEPRLPAPIEAAAYFVVAEALANVAKYAQATEATVAVRRASGRVTVDVTDDGIGGADAAQGSGLRGLGDRVAALDGTLLLESPPGRGTRLHVEIPCEPLTGPVLAP